MARKWRIAKSLESLRIQLNQLFPNRDKKSDGGIGDAAHASRSSDHNPWIIAPDGFGIVSARDFTHDPKNGIDCHKLAETLCRHRDRRIKYLIWNGEIVSSAKQPWVWRDYTGPNAHRHHLHISVMPDPEVFDDESPWKLDFAACNPVSVPMSESYTVVKGDSLGKIANKFQILVTDLVELNELESADRIKVGQVLKLR